MPSFSSLGLCALLLGSSLANPVRYNAWGQQVGDPNNPCMNDAPKCGIDWSTVTGVAMNGQPAAPVVPKPTSTAAYVVNPIIGQPAPEPPKITATSAAPKPTAASTTSEPTHQDVLSLLASFISQQAKATGVSKPAASSSFTA